MKKKVLLVVRWPVGGIRTFLRYVYRNFDSQQWQFTVLAPDLAELRVLIQEDLAGYNFRYVPTDANPSARAFAMKALTELAHGGYDLVHSHGFTSGVCTAVPAMLYRIRHLMTSHDVINEKQFSGIKGRLKKILIGWLFSKIDTIQSVSHDAQDNLLRYFPSLFRQEGKCVVIPNGIEIERFRDAPVRDLRGELGIGEDVFLIGFLGRFMSQKGFRFLVDAIEVLALEKDLPRKPLVVTFDDGGYVREERQEIIRRGLNDYFRFMPFAPNVAATIKGVDVVAMPSLWEACGLLAMEAMVCGTPFIGAECIGLREVMRETPAIRIPAADAEALLRGLSQEMHQSRKGEFLAFRQSAAERFCVRRTSQALQQLYSGLVGG